MTGTRAKRVTIAAGAAGLAYNLGGMLAAILIGLPESFARFGVAPTATVALLHVGLRFGMGLGSVLLYAGVREGWGAGPSTAIRVGLLVWLIGYLPGSTLLYELGVLSGAQLAFALLWGAGEASAATALGGWLYRER